jgi:hypothetical protein
MLNGNGNGDGHDGDGVATVHGEQSATTPQAAPPAPAAAPPQSKRSQVRVTREEAAPVKALGDGGSSEEEVFVRARDSLGSKRLTQKLRSTLQVAAADLARRKLIAVEDGEMFLLPGGRYADLQVSGTSSTPRPSAYGRRRYSG